MNGHNALQTIPNFVTLAILAALCRICRSILVDSATRSSYTERMTHDSNATDTKSIGFYAMLVLNKLRCEMQVNQNNKENSERAGDKDASAKTPSRKLAVALG